MARAERQGAKTPFGNVLACGGSNPRAMRQSVSANAGLRHFSRALSNQSELLQLVCGSALHQEDAERLLNKPSMSLPEQRGQEQGLGSLTPCLAYARYCP